MKVTFDVVVAGDKKSATLKMSVPDIPNAIEVLMEEKALAHLLGQLETARKQIAVTRIEEETSQPFNRKDWVGIDFSALDEDAPHDKFAQALADVLGIPKYRARGVYEKLREYGVGPKTMLITTDVSGIAPVVFDIEGVMFEYSVVTNALYIVKVDERGWPLGFFDRTFGALSDDPLDEV